MQKLRWSVSSHYMISPRSSFQQKNKHQSLPGRGRHVYFSFLDIVFYLRQNTSYALNPFLKNFNLRLADSKCTCPDFAEFEFERILEGPCLFCCTTNQIGSWRQENFACQGKQRSIKDLNI